MKRAGLTLLDVVLSIGIIGLLFGAIFLAYSSILDASSNAELRTVASTVLNRHVEVTRNLPYDQVGTVSGVPSGVIPTEQTSTISGVQFLVKTTVRSIDDPFDGTIGGTPNDTAPADYKFVELEVSCLTCRHFIPLTLTTTVAPRGLEAASQDGSLFVNAFDTSGRSVGSANVHVSNASVTPLIDLFDITNASGVLQLVGVPTSTQRYAIEVTKSGYSSEKTYLPGAPANPNPLKPHATVAAQTVTQLSFTIDKVSTIKVKSLDLFCASKPDADFNYQGAKLIGTSPDVLKLSTSSRTAASGEVTLANIEWDSYSFTLAEPGVDLLGSIPLLPILVNPDSNLDLWFVVASSSPSSLLVTVKDDTTGLGVPSATVNLSRTGFSETLLTGRSSFGQTDWSGSQYSSQSGGIDAESLLGALKLIANASGTYPTSTTHWLVSNTFDVGSSTSAFYRISWDPVSQPPQTGTDSLKFQLASNNDNATWNFVGPDGTSATYYTISSSTVVGHNGRRYFRYQVSMRTADENTTPSLNELTFEFSGACVPKYQVLFDGLSQTTYTVTVSAVGYGQETRSVTISTSSAATEILLTP